MAPLTFVSLVAEPDLAIFLEASHLALMDRTLFAAAIVLVVGFLIRCVTMLDQIGHGDTCLIQQVFAVFAANGDLAGEPLRGRISGIP